VSVTPYAATVNGSTISRSELDSAMRAIAANPGYTCLIESSSNNSQPIAGAGQDTFSTGFAAKVLTELIEGRVAAQEVARLGLPVGAYTAKFAREQAAADLSPPSSSSSTPSTCTESGATVLEAFSPSYRSTYLSLQLDQDILGGYLSGARLTAAGLARYARTHPRLAHLDCTSAILVSGRSLAEKIEAELARGVPFASLARRYTIDTATARAGGALGCIAPSELAGDLGGVISRLAVGVVSPPISFSGDYAIFLVTARRPEGASQLAAQILSTAGPKVTTFVNRLLDRARVAVDPSYGSWSTKKGAIGVQPPVAPASRFAPAPRAVQGVAPAAGASSSGGSGAG